MKKCKVIFAVAMAMAVLFVGVVFKIGASANGYVEHLSNQENKDDLVANGSVKKYDIAPKATQAVTKEIPIEKEIVDRECMKEMMPVFTGIAAYICETNSEYNAYSDKFYANSLKYVSFYAKDSLKNEVTVSSDNKLELSKNAMTQISGAMFKTRIYGYEEINLEEYGINYDEKQNMYKYNVNLEEYSIDINYVNKINPGYETPEDNYQVDATIYKDSRRVKRLIFTVANNELNCEMEGNAFGYSVKDVYENVEDDNWGRISEDNVEEYDKLLPVIAALGGHIHTRNSGYDAYKSSFYETSFSKILKYCEKDKLVEYMEDETNYYLDSTNMGILSSVAYDGGDYTTLQEINNKDVAYYDEELDKYVIRKTDVDMGYSVKLTKAETHDGKNNGVYYCYFKLEGELYKDGEKIDNIRISVAENKNANDGLLYNIHWVNLDSYGIEVY